LRYRASTANTDTPETLRIVEDVWKRAGDSWKLAVRYAGPAGSRDFVIPGASKDAPIVKRY
jgi:hypothetical protein